MLEPGVVRFGLGPLTEVVAQQHTFARLAPHLDTTLLPVVAQERVLRGEDLRDDPRAYGEPDDPPLVLQPFEPDYVLPVYRAAERIDGQVPEPSEDAHAGPILHGSPAALPTGAAPTDPDATALRRALEDVVSPWSAQSGGIVRVVAVRGTAASACRAALEGHPALEEAGGDRAAVRSGAIDVPTMLRLVAFAGASGGVHGRRRGGAAGRSLAWWVARCATGLHRDELVDPEDLEFRLEDLQMLAFRVPRTAAWRLELAIARAEQAGGEEWAVAVAAFDRSEAAEADDPTAVPQDGVDPASW
jgi:hypothetical protein